MRGSCSWLIAAVLAMPCDAVCSDGSLGAVRDQLDAAVAPNSVGELVRPMDDANFLRRVWLDLAGHIPPADLVREFLDGNDPEKRTRAVERLLRSEEFADHWGRVLTLWMTSERPIRRDAYDGRVLHEFLRDRLKAGASLDGVVREILAGSGASDASGPANFFLRYEADPTRLAGAVGQAFLGVTIRCAQCHDHPFARWNEEDFWGLAASFARVRKFEAEGGDDLKAVIEARKGELTLPNADASSPAAADEGEKNGDQEKERPAPKPAIVRPRLPDGTALPGSDRRRALADWVVSRRNPRFARNVTNRVWENLMGRPLVANLDDASPKVDSLPVLVLLADDFAANGHDLRRLVQIIVSSRTYAQASAQAGKPPWARPSPRAMSVDQLYASIAVATGYDGAPDEEAQEGETQETDDPHREASGEDVGGEEDEDRAVEALGEHSMTLQRALVLLNGSHVQDAARSGARLVRARYLRASLGTRLEWVFLSTLGRRPTEQEYAALKPLLDQPGGMEDVYWVLINSAEFQGIY